MTAPYAFGAYATQTNTARLAEMRGNLSDLQRQLATEKKSDSFSGLDSSARRASLDGRGRLAELEGFGRTVQDAQLRIKVLDQSLTQISKISTATRADLRAHAYTIGTDGLTVAQKSAEGNLQFVVDILNTKLGDRHLFSGRSSDVRPVVDGDAILNGVGAQAGLKQLIAERKAADLGATGLGRTVVASAGTNVTVTEEAAGLPFGFKLASVSSSLSNVAATGPAGAPASIALNVTGQPLAGQSVTIGLTLPDGTSETFALTAQAQITSASPKGSFAIGATPAATQANLEAALTTRLGELGATVLASASAAVAARDFFSGSANSVPQRVAGPPFNTATTFTPGTAANTLVWYRGDDRFPTDPLNPGPRATALAAVETNQAVPVGAQANETAFRNLLAQLATLAAESFAPNSDAERERYEALAVRLRDGVAGPANAASVEDVSAEIAIASVSINRAEERRKTQVSLLQSAVDEAENADKTEVAASLLALQTRLEASYQTTATLSRLTLTSFLR